ncbi:hypothetical protein Tco_0053139 [Tanacetum coccineum]
MLLLMICIRGREGKLAKVQKNINVWILSMFDAWDTKEKVCQKLASLIRKIGMKRGQGAGYFTVLTEDVELRAAMGSLPLALRLKEADGDMKQHIHGGHGCTWEVKYGISAWGVCSGSQCRGTTNPTWLICSAQTPLLGTEEVSDRFVAPCFINGLEAYDGEINVGVEENMISNEYAVKLCLEHEVKRGNKVVKKEIIVALRGEIYFMKFIINPEKDDVEPGVIFNDIPLLDEEGFPSFVCKMGKSSRNKKQAMENLNFFYQDIGTSSSVGGHLTQEEAAKEALAIRMS